MKFDCSVDEEFDRGLAAAQAALEEGKLVVLPTDTVYGIAADAFNPRAVQNLLDAKGRGRQMPPPVLVGAPTTLDALAIDIPSWLRSTVEALWPGPLTVICRQQPSLTWDLGETHNTVAVRMPADPRALALLKQTGPLAVSSANTTGDPAAHDDRRGRGHARWAGRGLPRRRAQCVGRTVHDPRCDRLDPAPAARRLHHARAAPRVQQHDRAAGRAGRGRGRGRRRCANIWSSSASPSG